MLDKTLSIILAGGAGARLHPLTAERAKPAVPFGGKYRIIDFTLSNCLHSGLRRILVLTQYKSHSLQKHLRDGWSIFNPEVSEYITPVPPQMRTGGSWYSGTADAILQNLYLLERSNATHVLILSGDHIYRMDYAALLHFHRDQGAELTIACMQVPLADASSFGVMSVDPAQRVREFHEKPAHPRSLPDDPQHALASMGVYVFTIDLLCRELKFDHELTESSHDFGKDIIPRLIDKQRVFAYRFGGEGGRVTPDRYWRDVGTVDSYYMANMDLLLPVPPINLYQPDWSIRTYPGQYPPARMAPGASGRAGHFDNSLICGGAVISGGTVRHSILSPQVRVDDNALVEDSILFDGVQVGAGALLKRCIIDKDVRVPPGEKIGGNPAVDSAHFTVSESGVTVVPKGYCF
ncbi:glucose-1-phosphate adenylyltransferase [Methylomicrobium sp. Wu6]|uniref:glucose-1-phosphate adenylyltransferase n=1 Tax=Methylomicrobium sp. Wu6 TaxID=3107928 RepID=UPI002DD66BCC|nr:glucose-1-phosphate adenylyltransferase [Methylomicrobium sp. Wu6]MEC4749063.1 glucose-1-phosphate adenylyltransferase [Methylomicrobium sp. Wu6]